jgi:hypothetical protein
MAEDIAKPVTELIPDFSDAFVGRSAVGTGITAVFHERNSGVDGAETVIPVRVDGRRQPVQGGYGGAHSMPGLVGDTNSRMVVGRRLAVVKSITWIG